MMQIGNFGAKIFALYAAYSVLADDAARSYTFHTVPNTLEQGQKLPNWLDNHQYLGKTIADRCMDFVSDHTRHRTTQSIGAAIDCVRRFDHKNLVAAYTYAIQYQGTQENWLAMVRLASDCSIFTRSCPNFRDMDISIIAQLNPQRV